MELCKPKMKKNPRFSAQYFKCFTKSLIKFAPPSTEDF